MIYLLLSSILIISGLFVTFQVIDSHSSDCKEIWYERYQPTNEGFLGTLTSLFQEFFFILPDDNEEIWQSDPNEFINEEGDHIYYERSIIEKKFFRMKHPETPLSNLRTFSRLLSFPKN